MSINAERSKMIREKIKAELGYNSRQVSIRSGDCGYSDYTRITVKDLSCTHGTGTPLQFPRRSPRNSVGIQIPLIIAEAVYIPP